MTTTHKILSGTSGLFVALLSAYLYAHIAGPDPGYTAAPGENPLACAICHTRQAKGGPINAGGGAVAPLVANGTPTILIGSMSVHPDFAGQAPGYPGVNQINLTIPSNAPTGSAVQVQIQSADGSVTSPPKIATVAIQ